jgi:hypothetical protein
MWLYFNWQSDRIQLDPGRIRPPLTIIVVPALVGAGIGFWGGGVWGILGVLIYAATIRTYALKARSPFWGPLGPLLRMINGFGQFFMVCGLSKTFPDQNSFIIAFALSIWLGARNLVGDVRDIRTDVYELPVRFGAKITQWIIRFGFVITGTMIGAAVSSASKSMLPILLIVVITFTMMEKLYAIYKKEPYKWGYAGHRVMVIATVALHLAVAVYYGLPWIWVLGMALLTITLHYCYSFLPGKNFPNLRELKNI